MEVACPACVGQAQPMFLLCPQRASNYGFILFSVKRLTAAGCNINSVEKGEPVSAQKLHRSYCSSEYRCSNFTLSKIEYGDCHQTKLACLLHQLWNGNESLQCIHTGGCVAGLSVSQCRGGCFSSQFLHQASQSTFRNMVICKDILVEKEQSCMYDLEALLMKT